MRIVATLPSATEIVAAQATWPDRSYLIVSLEPQTVGSWRWRSTDGTAGDTVPSTAPSFAGRFERERLVLE